MIWTASLSVGVGDVDFVFVEVRVGRERVGDAVGGAGVASVSS